MISALAWTLLNSVMPFEGTTENPAEAVARLRNTMSVRSKIKN
jgi:hypothetical protein